MLQVSKKRVGGRKMFEAQYSLFSHFHSYFELLLQQVGLQLQMR